GAVRRHVATRPQRAPGIPVGSKAAAGAGGGAPGRVRRTVRAPPLQRAVHGAGRGGDLFARLLDRAGSCGVTDIDLATPGVPGTALLRRLSASLSCAQN